MSYNINGGSGSTPASQTVTEGSSVILATYYGTKEGYDLRCWNTNSTGNGTDYSFGSSYTPTSNITLYARWSTQGGGGGTCPSDPIHKHNDCQDCCPNIRRYYTINIGGVVWPASVRHEPSGSSSNRGWLIGCSYCHSYMIFENADGTPTGGPRNEVTGSNCSQYNFTNTTIPDGNWCCDTTPSTTCVHTTNWPFSVTCTSIPGAP